MLTDSKNALLRLSTFALVALASRAWAQTAPAQSDAPAAQAPVLTGFPIATDRPSFSDSSSLMPMGRYQVEMGGTYYRVGGSGFGTFPELLFRAPLSDRFELRLVNVNYTAVEGGSGSGYQDPAVGFKVRLSRLNRRPTGEPELALVGLLQVPTGTRGYRADTVQPTIKLAAYVPISATDGFGGNLVVGFFSPKDAQFTQYAASVYWAHTFSPRLASFVETYGLAPVSYGGENGGFADAGFTYLLDKRTQVDIRYGTGFDEKRDGHFFGAGIAFRF